MQTKDTPVQINIQIIAVETIEFSLNPIDDNSKSYVKYNYNIQVKQAFDIDKNLVLVIPHIDIMHEDKETKLGSISINCVFKFDELSNYCNSKTKAVNLPEAVYNTFNSIAISTCRGVMASQFKGTILQNAILPLIKPKSFSDNKK